MRLRTEFPSLDILYIAGSKPRHGNSIGNRRFREVFSRLSSHFSVGLVEPSYRASFTMSEVDGIKVFHIPYVARFTLGDGSWFNYSIFSATTYALSPYYLRKLAKKTHIIHESMSPLPFYSKIYTKKKTLLTVHEIRGKRNLFALGLLGIVPFFAEFFLKRMHNFYDALIAVSMFTQSRLRDYGLDSYLAYNGVNSDVFEPKNLNENNDETKILTIGRLVPQKGYPCLIYSAKELVKKYKKIKFTVVGHGPMENRIKYLINTMGLSKYFDFYSNLSEEAYLKTIQMSDIYVHPNPYQEGFGLAIAEAMSCGIPVVAFDVPPLDEIVRNEVDGFLAPLQIKSFTEKIEFLIDNEDLRRKMGQNARRRITSTFSWDTTVEKMRRIYDKLLSDP